MHSRRETLAGMAGMGIAAGMPLSGAVAAVGSGLRTVVPAKVERPASVSRTPFLPPEAHPEYVSQYDYVQEEWFASGVDDTGHPYKTQILMRRPRDARRFSGTIIVESLHVHRIAPLGMYSSDYMMRSGHGWAAVVSQKTALDTHVKPADKDHYASLSIVEGRKPSPATPGYAFFKDMPRNNEASNAILAQTAAAIRAGAGSFKGLRVRHLVLGGHSQTGFITAEFLEQAHPVQRLAGGAPIFDGFFPAGFPMSPIAPAGVPVIQVISDGDVNDRDARRRLGFEGREYRRPDSDTRADRYRLYELAGVSHAGNTSRLQALPPGTPPGTRPNDLPHNQLFSMALDNLVQWVRGVTPPRAARLELDADGRLIAKDEYGNSKGGVRTALMDVPIATYYSAPRPPVAIPSEVPFDKATCERLYGTHANYMKRFDQRLDELVRQRWYLAQHVPAQHAKAAAATW